MSSVTTHPTPPADPRIGLAISEYADLSPGTLTLIVGQPGHGATTAINSLAAGSCPAVIIDMEDVESPSPTSVLTAAALGAHIVLVDNLDVHLVRLGAEQAADTIAAWKDSARVACVALVVSYRDIDTVKVDPLKTVTVNGKLCVWASDIIPGVQRGVPPTPEQRNEAAAFMARLTPGVKADEAARDDREITKLFYCDEMLQAEPDHS